MRGAGGWIAWGMALAAAAAPGPGYRFSLELADDVRFTLADRKRDEAIDQLREMIPRFDDDSPEKPDLLFQLSELYWEKHKRAYAREEKAHEAAYAAYEARRSRGGREPAPRADHRESDLHRMEAMKLYDQILSRYPEYGRTDEVLFSLAYNQRELGRQAEAIKRYRELIRRYPESRFVPDTWVQIGDHAFDRNDLAGAREAFKQAVKSKEPKIYSYALYKLAWCDYNAHEHEAALKKLQEVVEYAGEKGRVLVDLRNEALSDLVVIYTALNRPEEAERYFAARAPAARRARLLARLADALVEAGHEESALRLYGKLIAEEPMRPEAPLFQRSTVRALAKLGKRAQVRAEVKRLAEQYRPGGPWWQKNAGKEPVLRDAFDACEEALRNLAADYHKEAQETRQVETFRLARDLYRHYLDAFASSPDPEWVADAAFNQAFFYAEVLWTLEEWELAYDAYDRVVRFQVPDRQAAREVSSEPYRKIAAFNAILTADKLLKIERGQMEKSQLRDGQKVDAKKGKGGVEAENQRLQKKAAQALEEKPLTAHEERLVSACDTYVRLYPSERAPEAERPRAAKEEIDIRYQAAALLYDRNHAEESARRFGEIIARWPEDPRSQMAADLSMSVLEARQQWAELARLSSELAANKRLVKPGTPFGRRVQRVLEGARYKWIDEVVVKQEKDQARAAEELLRYAQELPHSAYADRALTYAMLIDRDRGQLERAVATGERALREYPNSPLEPKIRYTLCAIYERLADLPRAAEMAESFIAAYDRRRAALEQLRKRGSPKGGAAAEVEAEDGEKSPAGARAERIAEESALLKEAEAWLPDAHASAALWHEGLGRPEQAAAAYQRYLARFKDRPDAPQVQYALGVLREREQRWAEAARAFERFETAYGRDARVKPGQLLVAKYRRLLALRALRSNARAEALQAELVRAYQRLGPEARQEPGVTAAYAHARFLEVEPLWRKYTAIRFTRMSRVRQDLELKRKTLRELERSYLEVIQLGVGEWGIAALTRIGLAYAGLARDILESPTPPGLSAELQQVYRDELEKLALPLEEQALEALEKGLAKAYELNVYGEWTLAAQEQVNKLRPGSYPKAREVPPQGADAFWTAELDKGPAPGAGASP